MARMYSHRRGKSGSKKPISSVPSWAPYAGEEVEKLVIKYAKAGEKVSLIGMILRDRHGIQSVKAVTKKNISTILKEHNALPTLPEDLTALIVRMIGIKLHLEKNKQDKTALRGVILTRSKMQRLIRYYKSSKRLPQEWKLDESRLKMYLA